MVDYTVEAVEHALALLLVVAKSPGLGVTELALRSANTKARTFRFLFTLEKSGLLSKDPVNQTYSLGYNALYLGVAAESQISLARLAKTSLPHLGEACNENVQIRVREGLESVCVARWESSHHVRVKMEVGNRRPLYVGASSKILLANAPKEIIEEVLSAERHRFTDATLVSRDLLEQSIERVKRDGYVVSFGEMSTDSVAIAAPVYGADGTVIAAISIAGPSNRIKEENIPALLTLVITASEELSNALGYR